MTLRSSFYIWVFIGWSRLGLGAASAAAQYVVTHPQTSHNPINLDFLLDPLSKSEFLSFILFMTPLGWGWAGFVWGYALLWFLVNDRVKLLAYRIFDPVKKAVVKPETRTTSQADAKPDVEGDAKASTKPDAKPEAKAAAQDEDKAKLKPEIKAGSKAAPKSDAKPEVTEESKPEVKADPTTLARTEAKPNAKAEAKPPVEPQPESKVEPKREVNANAEPIPATGVKPASEVSPQLVERVHKLYEELGREDVRAVQESEDGERKTANVETKK